MASPSAHAALCGMLLSLAGCAYATDVLFPSMAGDPASAQGPAAAAAAYQASRAIVPATPGSPAGQAPAAGSVPSVPVLPPPAEQPPTGTYVGQQAAELRAQLGELVRVVNQRHGQLRQIRGAGSGNIDRYQASVTAIRSRLDQGTTPGNPQVLGRWNQAQADLDLLSGDIAALASLGNEVAADAGVGEYLEQRVRAAGALKGATEEDRRQLAVLQEEASRARAEIQRLAAEVNQEVTRRGAYVGTERQRLTGLAEAIRAGQAATGARQAAGAVGRAAEAPPLVVIRFDRPDVAYEEPLYTAVAAALERKPGAVFRLVAVNAPAASSAQAAATLERSRQNMEKVMQSLTGMGLPAERVTLSSTTSADAAGNEIRLYVR